MEYMDKTQRGVSSISADNVMFAVLTCLAVILAHAAAYMTHEYAHTFVAWSLGWMPNPMALDYGSLTLYNALFLGDVGDNVQYGPILAAGRGWSAAFIALSGTFLGNAVVYALLNAITKISAVHSSRVGLSAVYWTAAMCAGNVWGYVPIRAITTHADIAIAAKSLGISVWLLFPFLIGPSLYVVYHFFFRMLPRCIGTLAAGSGIDMPLIIALTAYWFFAFFGGDGTDGGYGLVSQLLAITSKYIAFPLAVMWLTSRLMPVREQTLTRQ
jgi:hypothetical protein